MFKDDVMCKKIFIFLAILFVASCGGGGGGSDNSSRSTLTSPVPSWVSTKATITAKSGTDLFGIYYENTIIAETLLREYSIFDILNFPNVWRRNTGSQRQSCDRSGSLLLKIDNSGRDTFVDFDDCVDSDGNTTNGKVEVKFFESSTGLKMTYDFIDLNISHSEGTSNIDLTYVFDIDRVSESIVTTINGRAVDTSEDDFDIQDLTFTSPISHTEYIFESHDFSGKISRENLGYVDLTATSDGHGFSFTDEMNTFEGGYELNNSEERFPIMRFTDGVSPSNNKFASLPNDTSSFNHIDIDFFTTENIAPASNARWRATRHDFNNDWDVYNTQNVPYEFHLNGMFYDPNGDFLEFEIEVVEYTVLKNTNYPVPSTINLNEMDIEIVENSNSEFSITFPQSGQYRLSFRAKDPDGAYSGYLYQWIEVEDDTDSDGIPSPNDRDDDGDGVEDHLDDFIYDDSETTDTDGDGIGNNADRDDDGDGVADFEDANPLDYFCSGPFEGNVDGCYAGLFYPDTGYKWENTFADSVGYFYFYSRNYKEIAVYSVGDDAFIPQIDLSNLQGEVRVMTYHEEHNRVYIGLDNGDIYYLVPGAEEIIFFADTGREAIDLYEAGQYLLSHNEDLNPDSRFHHDFFSYDKDGVLIDSLLHVLRTAHNFIWDKAFNYLYDDLPHTAGFDVISGLFNSDVSNSRAKPLALSPDGTKSVRFYDSDQLGYPVLETAGGTQIGLVGPAVGEGKPDFWFDSGLVGISGLTPVKYIRYWNNDFSFDRSEVYGGDANGNLVGYQWGGKLVVIGTGQTDEHFSRSFLIIDVIDID